jgi:O-antigen ligase
LNNSKKIRNCLIIIIGLAALIGIDALFQRFVGTDFLRHKKIVPLWGKTMIHGGAITGSFHHYNSLGAYLTFNLLLILTLLFSIGNKIYKIALFLIFVLLQACLIMTFSRGSWLGFFFGVILFLLLFPKANKLTLLVTIYIILIIFFPGLKERAMFADSDRFVVWKGTLKMIKNHPFLGMGLGTYMDYFQEYVSKTMYIRYAHNCYLQIWAESGIFSLISFMLFIGSIMFKGIRVFKKSNSFILLGLTCAFFAFLIHAFFDAQLYSLQLAVLFWFMAGLILAVVRLQGNPLIKAK